MQKLWIECQGKRVLADKAFKVVPKEDDVFDEVILFTENCINAGNNNTHCKNCLGVCISVNKEIFNPESATFEIKRTTLRDKIVKDRQGLIKEVKKATNYFESASKIFSLQEKEYNPTQIRTTIPWEAADRSDTWKTDCLRCRRRYLEREMLTPCQKASNYAIEQGVDVRYASKEQILKLELPEECICREIKQKIVYVY